MVIYAENSTTLGGMLNSVSVSSDTKTDSSSLSCGDVEKRRNIDNVDDKGQDKNKYKENESPEERRQRRKDRLHARMLVGGVSGLLVGGLFGGPIGSAIAGPATVVVVATTTKCGELCKDFRSSRRCHSIRKHEKKMLN